MATQTRGPAAARQSAPGRPAKRRTRTTPALFYRQVVAELRKVIWPTRRELSTYTIVALVFCVVMIAIVTSLDYGFTNLMFTIFG
jgi:preprotein translocase subunit SecE